MLLPSQQAAGAQRSEKQKPPDFKREIYTLKQVEYAMPGNF